MRRTFLLAVGFFACAPSAWGATWTNPQGPRLGQIFAIDTTGEPNWIYGAEDVLGDGLGMFTAAEQALDLRTAYASTDATKLWTRVYVSSAAAADPDAHRVRLHRRRHERGDGRTDELHHAEPGSSRTSISPGGYDFVLGIRRQCNDRQRVAVADDAEPGHVVVNTIRTQTAARSAPIIDPIRIGTALTRTCKAKSISRSSV